MGDIKIHALKVKRKGCLYHLSDSVSVCSVFNGLNKSWFIKVDASRCEKENNGCIGLITDSSAHVAGRLPDACQENLLLDVVPGQNLKQNAPGSDEQMSLEVAGGDFLKNLEVSVEGSDGNDKDLSVDANDNSPNEGNELEKTLVGGRESSLRNEIDVQGKVQPATVLVPSLDANDNAHDKVNELEKTPVGGGKSSSRNEIGDMQGKLQLETVLETESHKQKKRKGKRSKHPTHELSLSKDVTVPETVENESGQDVAASLAPQEIAMENVIGESSNEVRGTAAASGVIEKHVELKHDESRGCDAEGHNDEPMEDALQPEHAVKKKRKIEKKNDGDEYRPKKDVSSVDDSSKEMIEPSSISQHSPGDKHNKKNPTMDDVHLQSAGGSSGKRKRKKKSKDTPDQEIVALPSSETDAKGDRPALGTKPQSLGEESDALLASGNVEAGESSEPGAVSLNGHPIREANKRLFHQDIDKSNSDAGRYDDSGAAVASDTRSMKLSDSCTAIPVGVGSHHRESDNTEKEIEASRNKSMIIDQRVNEMNRIDDEKNLESKISEKQKVLALKELTSKSKEASVTSNLLEAYETVDPPKPSKKIKKCRKAKEVGGRTILTSAAENVEGFVSVAAPVKPHKDVNGDHTGDNVNREESNVPSKEGKELKELETSASLSVTEKEIDEVIQNAMHSVQQIGQDKVCAKIIDGKSTKKTRKKRSSEAKSLPEVGDENQKPSAPSTDDNLKKAENSSNGPPHSQSSEGQPHHTKNTSEGPAEVLVDRTSEAIMADVETKANKNKKKLRAHSHDPSPDLQNSHSLPKNHGVGGNHVKVSDSGAKAPPSSRPGELDSVPEKIRSSAVKPSATSVHAKSKRAASNSSLRSSKGTSVLNRGVNGRQPNEDHDHMNSRKTSRTSVGEIVNAIQHKKSVIGALNSIFNDVSAEASSTEDDSSDASTRTPSDKSPSSDYSDGESNADFNFSRNGSDSWQRSDGDWKSIRKPISSGVTLDTILRSSSRYKKAKQTASQMELEDTESQPVEFFPDSQPVELGT